MDSEANCEVSYKIGDPHQGQEAASSSVLGQQDGAGYGIRFRKEGWGNGFKVRAEGSAS